VRVRNVVSVMSNFFGLRAHCARPSGPFLQENMARTVGDAWPRRNRSLHGLKTDFMRAFETWGLRGQLSGLPPTIGLR